MYLNNNNFKITLLTVYHKKINITVVNDTL